MEKLQRLPDVVQLRILRRLMAGDLQPSQAPSRSLPPSKDLAEFLWRCLSPAERDSRVPLSSLGWALRQAVFHPVQAGGANRRLYLAILQNEKTMVRILAERLRHQRKQTRRLEQDIEDDFDQMTRDDRTEPEHPEDDKKHNKTQRREENETQRREENETQRREENETQRREEEDQIEKRCNDKCEARVLSGLRNKASCMRECRDEEAGVEPQGFLSEHSDSSPPLQIEASETPREVVEPDPANPAKDATAHSEAAEELSDDEAPQ